jgi:hypothetical protein
MCCVVLNLLKIRESSSKSEFLVFCLVQLRRLVSGETFKFLSETNFGVGKYIKLRS